MLAVFAFQGTSDDARTLLTTIAGTVVTVIALVLGLTVVALQLSSTQFSPRLLRNFLRDRATQRVLSVFLSTFTYSAAGLYTVGVAAGSRTEEFPRLAVSGAILLLFVTLAMVVYFADHLAHSIQIDAIAEAVQRNTLEAVRLKPGTSEGPAPVPPAGAVVVVAPRSGYIRAVYPGRLVQAAARQGVTVLLARMVGEHVVAGTELAWVWHGDDRGGDGRAGDDRGGDDRGGDVPGDWTRPVQDGVRIGFERTLEQDAAFGIRQLVDMACKALSPAVNDPYTAVQAVDHLSVIFRALAARPLGDAVFGDASGTPRVIVPARRFGDYLATMSGLIRRYGSSEPTLVVALLRLLATSAGAVGEDPVRRQAISRETSLILLDAEAAVRQPADLVAVRSAAERVFSLVGARPDDEVS